MKNLRFIALTLALALSPLATALAEAAPAGVLIVEVQTGGSGTGTAGQEFVKLHNPAALAVDVSGWKLQYRAANKLPADPWPATSTTILACPAGSPVDCVVVLEPYESVVVAVSALGLDGALPLNGGFADAGGQLRLTDQNGVVSDFVGYGSAVDFEGAAAIKPNGGESIKRKVDVAGWYVDTGNNAFDFTLACGPPSPDDLRVPLAGTELGCAIFEQQVDEPVEPEPQPEEPEQEPEPPVIEPQEPEPPVEQPEELPVIQLLLTEVFPDPASPQTDAEHEFVEIYNAGDSAVDLATYTLKTGDQFQNTVNLEGLIMPGQYVAVTASSTNLSLVNSGTAVRLVSNVGAVMDESPNYQLAISGQSWTRSEDSWQWSLTPTPNQENLITLPAEDSPPNGEEQSNNEQVVYLPVRITELLPDPESPAQDASDEFVELFNPGEAPISLKDYQLQSGADYRYKYVLPDVTLGAGEYLVFTSEESGLNLSNSGTGVRLLNPIGEVVNEVASYGKAVMGQSWAVMPDGAWRWTTTLTPAAQNVFTTLPPKASKAATKKASTTKKTAAKAKVASVSKDGADGDTNEFREPPEPPANYWLLGGVGSMALGYGVYEYRQGLLGAARRLWQLIRGKTIDE